MNLDCFCLGLGCATVYSNAEFVVNGGFVKLFYSSRQTDSFGKSRQNNGGLCG
jgi:hypothetical protein